MRRRRHRRQCQLVVFVVVGLVFVAVAVAIAAASRACPLLKLKATHACRLPRLHATIARLLKFDTTPQLDPPLPAAKTRILPYASPKLGVVPATCRRWKPYLPFAEI